MRNIVTILSFVALLASASAASAGQDFIAARNHANCASPAMASCMSSPYDREVPVRSYAKAPRKHHKADRYEPRAQYVPAPAPVRYFDPLYNAACEIPGWQFPSCPGIGN